MELIKVDNILLHSISNEFGTLCKNKPVAMKCSEVWIDVNTYTTPRLSIFDGTYVLNTCNVVLQIVFLTIPYYVDCRNFRCENGTHN